MTETKQPRSLVIPDDRRLELVLFFYETDINNPDDIIFALTQGDPKHTLLATLIALELSSKLVQIGDTTTVWPATLPEELDDQTQKSIDAIAGVIGSQITKKLPQKQNCENPPTLEKQTAFVRNEEVMGLVDLLHDIMPYVSKKSVEPLQGILDDFEKLETQVFGQIGKKIQTIINPREH